MMSTVPAPEAIAFSFILIGSLARDRACNDLVRTLKNEDSLDTRDFAPELVRCG